MFNQEQRVNMMKIYISLIFIQLAFVGCQSMAEKNPEQFGQCYRNFFSAQVKNPGAPEDASPADALPGAIGNAMYKKKYIKSMTVEKEEKKDSVGRELSDLN
jgi:PBP1b-binding outer membrane lipoprotein LpoB